MNKSIIKLTLIALFVSLSTIAVKAQKIDEKELKVNVDKITNSTDQLRKLQPVTFNYDVNKYKHLSLPSGNQYGFIASNVESEFPHLVYEASKVYTASKNTSKVAKYNEVNTESLIPVLVAAINEQQEQIDLLKKELELLKAKK